MPSYNEKKAHFNGLLTVYGRNPVLEALAIKTIKPMRLHLAENNKKSPQLDQIIELAKKHDCEILYHDRMALSRISKNRKQDQGVALDIQSERYLSYQDYLKKPLTQSKLIALDGIHNPQNLGMILRSCAAGFIDGVLLPAKGCADISPLTIKASAGAVFHCQIIRCNNLNEALLEFKEQGFSTIGLSLNSKENLFQTQITNKQIFILGNETSGISALTREQTDKECFIPMKPAVESLNVAITAALIAYHPAIML